jgi:hypothetical protein
LSIPQCGHEKIDVIGPVIVAAEISIHQQQLPFANCMVAWLSGMGEDQLL